MKTSHIHDFQIGTRVKVINCGVYSKRHVVGKYGIVDSKTSYGGGKLAVRLDGMRNNHSSRGWFYFKPSELEFVDDCNIDNLEEENMQNITNYLNIAKVQFVDGNNTNTYDYANFEVYLSKGDLCVVKSAHHGLGIARVVEIVERNDIETQREVVAKVDTYDYDRRVENRAKAAELKAKMKERAKQLQDIALYQMLAKDDPDMLKLLEEYQALPNM